MERVILMIFAVFLSGVGVFYIVGAVLIMLHVLKVT
jgi:hypothetical protein